MAARRPVGPARDRWERGPLDCSSERAEPLREKRFACSDRKRRNVVSLGEMVLSVRREVSIC